MLARLFANAHGFVIVAVTEPARQNPRVREPAYVVYRKRPHVRLGRRKDPRDLIPFMRTFVPGEIAA